MTNLTHLNKRLTFACGSQLTSDSSTRRLSRLAFACFALFCLSTMAMAQAGHLDTTFGNGQPGIFSFSQSSASGSSNSVTAIALQTDGKIVIAGQAGNRSALLRLTTAGNLDSTFGSGGVVISRLGGDINTIFTSMALQLDGKILVTASGCPPRDELARFNADGSLDTSFGSSGVAALSFRVFGVTVQSDGKILVTGANYPTVLMARLLGTGQLDSSFGTGGQAPLIAAASAVALQSDGKILVASGGTSSGSLARYNTNGSLDKTFGIFGQAATITPLNAIAVQTNGSIVGVGANTSRLSLSANSTGFGLVRFNTNGVLDTTFGTRGGITTAFANAANTTAASVSIQATNGDIVAAGSGTSGTSSSFTLARYLSTGKLDSTFGSAGLVTTSLGSNTATVASMVLQGDGKIVVAGTVSGQVIEVARYLGQ